MNPQLPAALTDPTHPQHHFTLGQFLGVALLGLAAYQQTKQPAGAAAFLDPTVTGAYLAGVLSILNPPAPSV